MLINFNNLFRYLGRLYIFKGIKIQPLTSSDAPDSYLIIKHGKDEVNYKTTTKREATIDPEYYVNYDY